MLESKRYYKAMMKRQAKAHKAMARLKALCQKVNAKFLKISVAI